MLDADRADTVRVSVAEARALGERALRRIGYPAEDAAIITDQLIDNSLCGYRFASLPRILAIAEDEKTARPRTPFREREVGRRTGIVLDRKVVDALNAL